MAKLLDLFESREDDIYGRFPQKASGEDEPYIVIPLNEAEPMDPFYEDQTNPASRSALRDVKRMTEFSTATKGLIFLAKQQLLQSGNTFADTRLYNPLNVIVHSVPFIHEKRHVNLRNNVIQSILEGIGVEFGSPSTLTSLQRETVEKVALSNPEGWASRNAFARYGILNSRSSTIVDTTSAQSIKESILNAGLNFAKKAIDQIISPATRTISGIRAQIDGAYAETRPEIDGNRSLYYDEAVGANSADHIGTPESPSPVISKYIDALSSYKNDNKRISIGIGTNKIEGGGAGHDGRLFVRQKNYYKDLTQLPDFEFIRTEEEFQTDNRDSDSIDVLFRVRNPDTKAYERVRFRALINGIQESVSPSYNENKYIGRYEKFYTYDTTVRDLSFSLVMHAFSKEELARITQKLTYLTSLAYPIKSGESFPVQSYLTPLILQISIGSMYTNQPAILFNLQHTIEEDSSWDIDEQMPMTVNSSITLRLLDRENYDYRLLRNSSVPFGRAYMLRPTGTVLPETPTTIEQPTAPDFTDLL